MNRETKIIKHNKLRDVTLCFIGTLSDAIKSNIEIGIKNLHDLNILDIEKVIDQNDCKLNALRFGTEMSFTIGKK